MLEVRFALAAFGYERRRRRMLKLIEGSYTSFLPREIDAMHRDRAEIFSDRLGWEVTVKNGYERDEFDDANPLYLVSVDPDTEEYRGSLRMLPTTGPTCCVTSFRNCLTTTISRAPPYGKFRASAPPPSPASQKEAGAASILF
jgi:hypothetical protein